MAKIEQPEVTAQPALRVSSVPERFWRAGMAFGREPVVVPLTDLTAEQADAIRSEPLLRVEEVTLVPEGQAGG